MTQDIAARLGASGRGGGEQITVFVPSVDRDGTPIDQAYWIDQTLTAIGTIFGGGTAFPPGRGVWRDDERGGNLVFDDVQMVVSYVDDDVLDDPVVARELRAFLHRMGRETNQGEIGVVVSGSFLHITEYDEEHSDG